MKKSEIVQLALIVIGILIIVRTIEALVNQARIFFDFQVWDTIPGWLYLLIFSAVILMIVAGFLIIIKSEYLSKKIIKEEAEGKVSTTLNKSEILTISILILSMYFVITGFPSFMGSLFLLGSMFFDNFRQFKETLPKHVWVLIQYLIVVFIFLKSKYISHRIEKTIMN